MVCEISFSLFFFLSVYLASFLWLVGGDVGAAGERK